MTMAWDIVVTMVREHFADKFMENCDDKGQGAF